MAIKSINLIESDFRMSWFKKTRQPINFGSIRPQVSTESTIYSMWRIRVKSRKAKGRYWKNEDHIHIERSGRRDISNFSAMKHSDLRLLLLSFLNVIEIFEIKSNISWNIKHFLLIGNMSIGDESDLITFLNVPAIVSLVR